MKHIAFILLLIIPFSSSFPQENIQACQVLMIEISGSYQGGCKNGLADGKGIATGEESYKGSFLKGLPDGRGVYNYKNGSVYSGQWKNGLKDGEGKYTHLIDGKTMVLRGYWKEGNYAGANMPGAEYTVTNRSSIEYYSIKKVSDDENLITISFERGMDKYIPKDLETEISTGYINTLNQKILVHFNSCPVYCSLHFTISTSAGRKECSFEFIILRPGEYEVFISNN
jgi:hypothetical protein